jgi:hypothetical protein
MLRPNIYTSNGMRYHFGIHGKDGAVIDRIIEEYAIPQDQLEGARAVFDWFGSDQLPGLLADIRDFEVSGEYMIPRDN